MRFALTGLLFLCLPGLAMAEARTAETRTFVIANASDGYGVDMCLANGEPCGRAAANSYCTSQGFASAASFRKAEVTGTVQPVAMEPARKPGWFSTPLTYIAIACAR